MGASCNHSVFHSAGLTAGDPDEHIGVATSQFVVEREASLHVSQGALLFRCGHCLTPLPEVDGNPTLRCPACRRRNALPDRAWVNCLHCGFEQRISVRRAGAEPRCTSCGHVLTPADVVLKRMFRRRRRSARSHMLRRSNHEQAVLLLFLLGVAALLSLRVLSLL
ncbi:MAG: hypothetical protein PVJ57_13655 [Phycisphaerae bacterium]|jgi:DNA-directed RNA polymerase subunit RPC12/RpoP